MKKDPKAEANRELAKQLLEIVEDIRDARTKKRAHMLRLALRIHSASEKMSKLEEKK